VLFARSSPARRSGSVCSSLRLEAQDEELIAGSIKEREEILLSEEKQDLVYRAFPHATQFMRFTVLNTSSSAWSSVMHEQWTPIIDGSSKS